jgi:7-cyano-7-deazaguanine synthase in queuosine biosynthesis
MKTIQIDNLSIDIHQGPIGHMMSGGADSAILFYILMLHSPGPIHIFSCANGKTKNQEVEVALRVINYVMNKFSRNDITFHANWQPQKTIGNYYNYKLGEQLNISMVYSAFTTPPPDGAFDFDRTQLCGGVREPGVVYPHYFDKDSQLCPPEYKEVFKGSIYAPFANIDKKGIASLYKNLGIEDLYSVTRSCEHIDYVGKQCGVCWWCKERIWAFGKLE